MGKIDLQVDTKAIQDVSSKLDAIDALGRSTPKALVVGAELILAAAKERAPVRTGELKESLRVQKRARKIGRITVEVGALHAEAPHAHLVEHGHGGPKPAPPHPFLEPAADAVKDAVMDAIMEELKKSL